MTDTTEVGVSIHKTIPRHDEDRNGRNDGNFIEHVLVNTGSTSIQNVLKEPVGVTEFHPIFMGEDSPTVLPAFFTVWNVLWRGDVGQDNWWPTILTGDGNEFASRRRWMGGDRGFIQNESIDRASSQQAHKEA